MKLRHARYFLAVAEERNFTRAAEKLGARLSQCVAHCAELTKVGEAFLIETQTILAGAERANVAGQRAHRGQSGMLLLGLSGSAAFNLLYWRDTAVFIRPGLGGIEGVRSHRVRSTSGQRPAEAGV